MKTSEKFIIITYLIYIITWELFIFSLFGYVVFILGENPLWMALCVFMSTCAYPPEKWNKLINRINQIDKK